MSDFQTPPPIQQQGQPVAQPPPGGAVPTIIYQQIQDHPNMALVREIQRLVHKGYQVIQQTNTSAQLVKKKKFSFFWAFMWFLLMGVGILVYIFYYMAKRDQLVYLQVVGDRVTATKGI